jgi:hypothetical protein
LFFLLTTVCKKKDFFFNNFFKTHVIDTKNIFFTAVFFTADYSMPFNFQSWRFVFKESLYTQNQSWA